ncbi:GTP-binding protein [Streptomyces canus]|uniref:GTP-binding protein n=1 Tax=Streptomyces canus TaxID=58343 RepID=UPI002E2E7EF5|nr:ATP/GTP-binding protein [Streptomyces canus]
MPDYIGSDPDPGPGLRGDERTVKALVVGHMGAGKTTMVDSISEIEPVKTEEAMTDAGTAIDRADLPDKTTTTVAMDFGRVHLSADLVLYLFGAPGQARFFDILEDLARGALGALVLCDPRHLAETYPILEVVEDLGLPYVIAVNEFDDAPRYTEARLREVMGLDPSTPLVSCDARQRGSTRDALIVLVQHLLTTLPEPVR